MHGGLFYYHITDQFPYQFLSAGILDTSIVRHNFYKLYTST